MNMDGSTEQAELEQVVPDLPADLCAYIFKLCVLEGYFDPVKQLRLTSKTWKECINDSIHSLTLEFERGSPVTLDGIGSSFPELSDIIMLAISNGSQITNLSKLPKLTHLKLIDLQMEQNRVGKTALRGLSMLTSLRSLNVRQVGLMDREIAGLLTHLTALTALTLKLCDNVDADFLENLQPLSSLQSISMERCGKLNDAALSRLVTLPALSQISISGWNVITQSGFAALSSISSLDSLSISTSRGLRLLPDFPNITSLHVSSCSSFASLPTLPPCLRILKLESLNSLTSLPDLSTLPELQAITIVGCTALNTLPFVPKSTTSLTIAIQPHVLLETLDTFLLNLVYTCINLKQLHLVSSSQGVRCADCLYRISPLTTLKSFSLMPSITINATYYSDPAPLPPHPLLPGLTSLELRNTPIAHTAAQALVACTNLLKLSLTAAKGEDWPEDDPAPLHMLTQLQNLEFTNCNWSLEALHAARAGLPKIQRLHLVMLRRSEIPQPSQAEWRQLTHAFYQDRVLFELQPMDVFYFLGVAVHGNELRPL